MHVRQFRGVATHRIDHDHGPGGVLGNLLQDTAGAREAMGLVGVLSDEQRKFTMLEVPTHAGPEHPGVHPELAGLLLGQRAGAVPDAVGRHRRRGVGAAEVVALSAAAVVEDRLPAVRVLNAEQSLADLRNRCAPVDLLEAAVLGAPQRSPHAVVGPVLVGVELQRLVAGVAPACRMLLVTANLGEGVAVVAEQDLDAAVGLAQDAGAGMPNGVIHKCS